MDKQISLVRVFTRNQALYNGRIDKSVQQAMIRNKLTNIDWGAAPDLKDVFCKRSYIELGCMFLLHTLELKSADDRPMTLYQLICSMHSAVELDDCYHRMLELLPNISFKLSQSVRQFGVLGESIYADWKAFKYTPEEFMTECMDVIFGRDTLGTKFDSIIGETYCANIVDLCSEDALTSLLELFQKKNRQGLGFSSFRGYCMCRGMLYLDQTIFLQRGLVCGESKFSYVYHVLSRTNIPEIRSHVLKTTKESGFIDMVILNSKSREIAYMSIIDFEQFVSDMNGVPKIGRTEIEKYCCVLRKV